MRRHIFLNPLVFCYSCAGYSKWRLLYWNKYSSKLFPCWFICCLCSSFQPRLLCPSGTGWADRSHEQGVSPMGWSLITPSFRHPIVSAGHWAGSSSEAAGWAPPAAPGEHQRHWRGARALGKDAKQAWQSWTSALGQAAGGVKWWFPWPSTGAHPRVQGWQPSLA